MHDRARDIERAVTREVGGFDLETGAAILRAMADSTGTGEAWSVTDLRRLADAWSPGAPRSGKVW